MLLQPPGSPLFPYTTLFRSPLEMPEHTAHRLWLEDVLSILRENAKSRSVLPKGERQVELSGSATGVERHGRSEEHTSELQSRGQLVCRLLLEKKKQTTS